MIELFTLPPDAFAHHPELPLPLWLQLSLTGAVTLVISLVLTLS